MSKGKIFIGFYFLTSLLNLEFLRQAGSETLSSFMVSRGLVGVLLSLGMFALVTRTFLFSVHKHMKRRIVYGGAGMTMQIMGASQIPIPIYALLNRATPIWFSMMTGNRKIWSGAVLVLVTLTAPLFFQNISQAMLMGIGAMALGTLLIAFSQKSQIDGATAESKWLMPFAPAFGITVLGLALGLVNGKMQICQLGLISGFVMVLSYWFAHPLIVRSPKGGARMILCDLVASVVLGLAEIFRQGSLLSLVYIGLTICVFLFARDGN